jgi:hypothetical protein
MGAEARTRIAWSAGGVRDRAGAERMTGGRMPLFAHRTHPAGLDLVKEPHVTLAGDRSGEYLIAEERPDGSLLLLPDTPVEAIPRSHGRPPREPRGA